MNSPITSFEKNIESIKSLDNIHKYFFDKLSAIDLSEILRAELVLIVSAFDCYIHDAIKMGMLEIFQNQRSSNVKFEEFNIPMSYVQQIISSENSHEKEQLLSTAIKKNNNRLSFQSPSSIENALQLISVKKIWTSLKSSMDMESNDIKGTLGLIVNRRNKIAHEADIDPISGEKIEITRDDITEILDFITLLTSKIDELINNSTQQSA